VANTTETVDVAKMPCDQCHPKPQKPRPDKTHIDGQLELSPMTCWTCHGTQASGGAPGPSLTGDTATSSPRVGAHARHLDSNLSNRIGKVLTCDKCHTVPQQVFEESHFGLLGQPVDTTPSVEVKPWSGTYTPENGDPATSQSCVVYCHWNNGEPGSAKPAPQWTKDSGMTPTCTFCHDFPPKYLKEGSPHTQAPAQLDACKACHPFTPDTHVDGKVDLLTGAAQ
jgi:hypothetical protein